ncbi:histidine phosphatase family protein [Ferrovibrio xuzhouensis]|uniref:Histidine phosphatase family protein n=1 Tax=Ferrovibrio xuzhouensis TaxID=1576914 RepID=A0ABV7V979_9PROT
MIRLALLRHGATAWNAEHRLQGRSDIPLSEAGLAQLRGRHLPDDFAGRRWLTSPLQRAVATAEALGIAATVEPAVTEMHWGVYEGHTPAELQAIHGAAFTQNEARGLDLQPPGGESPRAVQARLQPWLRRLAAAGTDAGAVTHKGVIRALLAQAWDWPMLGKPPVKLDWQCLHDFRITDDGRPELLAANIPLA